MRPVRNVIGGLGNLMFKQAFLYAQAREGVIPDVYVQSERYWEKYKDEVRAMYSEGIGYIDMVSLQVRRGDYVNNSFYVDLSSTDYYQKAIEHFPNEKFLIFCHDNQDPEIDRQDKEWVLEFLNSFMAGRYVLNTPGSETDDLNKMASCKGHIMANGTFAWWGSYLGHGKTVCPKNWFTDGVQRCELLNEWTLI